MVVIFMNLPLILQSEHRAVHPSPVPKWIGAYAAQHLLWVLSANVVTPPGTHLHTSEGQWREGLSKKSG